MLVLVDIASLAKAAKAMDGQGNMVWVAGVELGYGLVGEMALECE